MTKVLHISPVRFRWEKGWRTSQLQHPAGGFFNKNCFRNGISKQFYDCLEIFLPGTYFFPSCIWKIQFYFLIYMLHRSAQSCVTFWGEIALIQLVLPRVRHNFPRVWRSDWEHRGWSIWTNIISNRLQMFEHKINQLKDTKRYLKRNIFGKWVAKQKKIEKWGIRSCRSLELSWEIRELCLCVGCKLFNLVNSCLTWIRPVFHCVIFIHNSFSFKTH